MHTYCVRKRIYHVSFENMVHDLMTWQLCAVHQQLEHKLQPRIHFAASRLAFAFFATSLRIHIVRHDSGVRGVQNSDATNLFFCCCYFVCVGMFVQVFRLAKISKKTKIRISNCTNAPKWSKIQNGLSGDENIDNAVETKAKIKNVYKNKLDLTCSKNW